MDLNIARNALLRSHLNFFIQKCFYTVTGEDSFYHNWHIDVLAEELEKCRSGNQNRLIINLPPRSLKSICASVAFPAWILGHDPTAKIICVSYSQELAEKFARDTRILMESEWYKELFPQTRLDKSRTAVHDFNTTQRGGRFTTSIGGTLTGRGGNYIIIDDPSKPNESMNIERLEQINEWYASTLYSRLDNKQKGSIILLMQRLHENDLTGYLLEKSNDSYKIIKMPAIAEKEETWNAFGKTYLRKPQELLNPKLDTKASLLSIKEQLGSYFFSAQYQQDPIPQDGNLMKEEWFQFYENLPSEPPQYILQSWDTANTVKESSAYTVCTTFLIYPDKKMYLVDVYREKRTFPELRSLVKQKSKDSFKHYSRPVYSVIENHASGVQLLQDLKQEGLNLKEFKPEGNKEDRFMSITPMIESGQILFPKKTPSWWPLFKREMLGFPNTTYKDQVDSFSQACLFVKEGSIRDWSRI